ncbi:MAG: NADH-quinone oxidoreductase subunit J [Chloroflexi bacterium]|nr:NADH-quinone oxidoreductase subunit J [Chloroflexota bacterium]
MRNKAVIGITAIILLDVIGYILLGVFGALAVNAIISAIGMLTSRNAVHSALWLVLNFATIAVLYITLNAPFIGMVQITVYAGAIMVLFLFVIMLLGADQLSGVVGEDKLQRYFAGALGIALIVVFAIVLAQGGSADAGMADAIDSSPTALGLRLFEGYVFPFEVTGVLLLTAMIGVVVLGRKKRG